MNIKSFIKTFKQFQTKQRKNMHIKIANDIALKKELSLFQNNNLALGVEVYE